MKRATVLVAFTLAATMTAVPLVGCGGQTPAQSTASETVAAEQTQDEIVAELKDAIANGPAYQSVTLTEITKSTFQGDAEATEDSSSDTIDSRAVYKFDASGEKLKTDMTAEIGDVTIRYVSDGDDAVCVTDGPVYSGTTEQFDQSHFAGVDEFLTEQAGDLNTIVDCVDAVEKERQGDLTVYTLTLNPERYMASDEILTMMKEYGDPVVSAVYTLSFDDVGHIVSTRTCIEYKSVIADTTYTLSDFDSTTVEAMPPADKTYEEMEADIAEKLDAFAAELDITSEYEDKAATEAK